MSKWKPEECYHEAFFEPRYYEVDTNRDILIPCLLRYMQETALQQIINLRLSYWDMRKLGVTWIFRRGQLHIDKFPKLGEKVRCITYASYIERFLTHRDYKIYDQNGGILATLASEWVLLDYNAKRICRIEETLGEIPILKTEDALKFKPFKIKPQTEFLHQDEYRVRKYDLDFNGHVNNACYSEWIMESLPEAYFTKALKDYNIHFKQEALLDESITVDHAEIEANHLQHTIRRKNTGDILCLAESKF